MSVDLKKWLTEDMGFTAEEANTLLPQFESRADKLEKGFLRQSDYSKHMNDLTKTQKALEEKDATLTRDMAEWAEMTAAEQAKAGDLRKRIEEGDAKVFALTQKVTRLAEESGVDPKTVLGDQEPVAKKEPPAFDPTDLRTQIGQQIGGVADYMMTLSAELPAIAQEHFELTGERLDTRAFIAGIKADIKAGKTQNIEPVARWEAQFGIPAKRSEKSATERAAELTRAREEGRQAAMSEAALPNTHPRPGTTSPLFKTSNVTAGSKLQRPQPGQRFASAVEALATGKYRKNPAA